METNEYKVAAFGELVLRLHSKDGKRFLQAQAYEPMYGGAEANVSVLLSQLGIPAKYITRIPDNHLAQAGIQQLNSYNVYTGDVLYGGDTLGLYFTEGGNVLRPGRVIYNRDASSYAALQPGMIDWKKVLEGVEYFHWSGVAAAISQGGADVCAEALQIAKSMGIRISSDFNYRSSLWKYGKHPSEVMPRLLQDSEVVVADLDSANIYYGIETPAAASVEERFQICCKALQQHLPAMKYLGMSFRRTVGLAHHYSGALFYNGECYFNDGFQLPYITDQIGSGDAFTAGLLHSIISQKKPQDMLSFAIACGALKQSIHGDWAIINAAEVEQFIRSGATGRIIR